MENDEFQKRQMEMSNRYRTILGPDELSRRAMERVLACLVGIGLTAEDAEKIIQRVKESVKEVSGGSGVDE